MTSSDIVQKLWGLCDVLRDDGINYSDYVTELVLLLFIKMEHENVKAGVRDKSLLPKEARWAYLSKLGGVDLLKAYRQALLTLSESRDARIAAIYAGAQTQLDRPHHLEQLIKSRKRAVIYILNAT